MQKVRLIDVAEKAGVSRVAAGHVLLGSGKGSVRVSTEAKEQILKVAKELDYQPNRNAQRLSGGTGNLIGVVISPNAPEIERERLVTLERIAWEKGYQLLISSFKQSRSLKNALQPDAILKMQGAAGIMHLKAGLNLSKYHPEKDIPENSVYCGIPPTIGKAPGVVLDLAHGYKLAIKHFADSGKKRIGVLNINVKSSDNIFSKYRMDAVKMEADHYSELKIFPKMVESINGNRTPDLESAELLVNEVVKDKIDAILTHNDTTAARIIQVLNARRIKVPEEIAICGLNNLSIAELTSPSLTTIDERSQEVSAAMLELLLERIHSPEKPIRQLIIKPKIVIRESS
jgi:DNA-binding LacI/PurR family transcriptional regulator